MNPAPVLYVVVCGAGPASQVTTLIEAAQADGWRVQVISTPAGLDFIDAPELEALTGNPVRSSYRGADEPRQSAPKADAIIVAPATYNTINKLTAGIADNYALGVLAECIGSGVPTVVLPFINAALASRAPLRNAVENLRGERVDVMLGPGGFEPHAPGTGDAALIAFPWTAALARAASLTSVNGAKPGDA